MKNNSGKQEDKNRGSKRVMAERRAEAEAVTKNMARLRALRLEREATQKDK
jgi:hypothetical protein